MAHVSSGPKDVGSAAEYLPAKHTYESLVEASAECKACDLWMKGTRTVFGEGATRQAELMFVGEQPGDIEDQQGHPFVGPAGRLLDEALERAGIDRKRAYVTNAVKHFNWEETKGKRRIHKKPSARHIASCHPWLEAEIQVVQPRVIVALGAVAASALFGPSFRLTQHRGELVDSPYAEKATATVHPSSILRAQTDDDRRIAMEAFVADLKLVESLLEREPARR
jgi:uracil-DNA glycosylase